MADNKQGFLSYMWDQAKDTFSPTKLFDKTVWLGWWLLRWANNAVSGRNWGDENTTFGEAISWQLLPKNNSVVEADSISSSPEVTTTQSNNQNLTNSVDFTVSSTTPPATWWIADDANATIPSGSFVDITNLEVQDLVKKQNREKEIEDESWWETVRRWLKWKGNSINDMVLGSALDSAKQANEKHLMLAYDPDSRDVTELVINKWQWYTDDFWNTIYNRGEWNETVFNNLYSQYQQRLREVENSNLTQEQKYAIDNELFNMFLNEVNERGLLKAFKNDHYSDWLVWGTLWKDIDFHWRLDNKFTKEQLDAASKRKVDEWVYKASPSEFADFLEVYENNNELENALSIKGFYWKGWEPEKANISYLLTEESVAEMQSQQSEQVLEPVRQKILELEDNWTLTPRQWNDIETRLMLEANNLIANMHFWLDTPLALYTVVKNKTEPLTDWERAVLWYWPGIQEFMQKYVDAVARWELETLKNIRNWDIISAPDMIDWMSINDFFRSYTDESNLKAGWWDLLPWESSIDAMQHINNNISYLYWKWKWNSLRRNWTEAQHVLWPVWYTAWELASLWFNWIFQWLDYLVGLTWNNSLVSDYALADMMSWLTVKTDMSDFWRLISSFWGKLIENWPEFWWEVAAMNMAYPGNLFKARWLLKIAGDANKINKANKTIKATQKMWLIKSWIKKVRDAIGVPAYQVWGRPRLQRMINWVLKSAEWENLITNNIVKIWQNIAKWAISDQLIDWLVSYYDTEPYSDTSFLLSVGFTWLTEILAPLVKDTQMIRMIRNGIDWRGLTQNTAWRVMSYLNTDEKALKRLEYLFGKNNIPLETLKNIWDGWSEYEDIMEQAYNLLKSSWVDMDKFSKQVVYEQLRKLGTIDWESKLWREIINLVNTRGTNAADVFKLIFWVPGKLEVGGFISKILLKDVDEWLQTRLLKQDYDIGLDILEWGFRKRLKSWFTLEDIQELQRRTKHDNLIKWWDANEKFFAKEWDKYYLTSSWAEEFKLDVSEYTESMRRADMRRATEEETKNLIDEKTKQLMSNKWLTKEVIEKLASSWAFKEMVDDIATVVCKIR